MRDTQKQRRRQREKQAPQGGPNMELDPRTPGSHPEPKAEAQPLSPPGVPARWFHTVGQLGGGQEDGLAP